MMKRVNQLRLGGGEEIELSIASEGTRRRLRSTSMRKQREWEEIERLGGDKASRRDNDARLHPGFRERGMELREGGTKFQIFLILI